MKPSCGQISGAGKEKESTNIAVKYCIEIKEYFIFIYEGPKPQL